MADSCVMMTPFGVSRAPGEGDPSLLFVFLPLLSGVLLPPRGVPSFSICSVDFLIMGGFRGDGVLFIVAVDLNKTGTKSQLKNQSTTSDLVNISETNEDKTML